MIGSTYTIFGGLALILSLPILMLSGLTFEESGNFIQGPAMVVGVGSVFISRARQVGQTVTNFFLRFTL